jgi:hypothetical protein
MRDAERHPVDLRNAGHRLAGRATTAALALILAAAPVRAGDHAPFAARVGTDIATAAAKAWAPDAFLIYVENDEDLDDQGSSARWGYLFYSPSAEKSRAYSVRDGKILVAENLPMHLEAPPVAGDWIDSGAALQVAERNVGQKFRRDHRGELRTMLLMRSAFQEGDPDQTTWTLIYSSPDGPSLFVVIDATEGKVRKTWRG